MSLLVAMQYTHKQYRFFIAVAVSMFFCSLGLAQPVVDPMPGVEPPDPDRLIECVVHRVIDGDSVELFVGGRIVRYELAGADSPDVVADGKRSLRGSAEAKNFLEALLVGERLGILADVRRPTDAMGRLRGYLYRLPDGMFVNLEMVRLGFAKHARDPGSFNSKAMQWAQNRARDARKGVWSVAPVVEPIDEPVKNESSIVVAGNGRGDQKSKGSKPQVQSESDSSGDSPMVYVTKYGSKYHTKDCQHARESGIAKRLDEVEATHKPCKACEPDQPDGDGGD